ncbi:histidine kinase [Pustulibacterium marinum]|nr:histidine kinase [Pustulibacterium marinum]
MNKLCLFLFLLCSTLSIAQIKTNNFNSKSFELRGSVKEENSKKPIEGIEVYIIGSSAMHVFTNEQGRFRLQAKIGDELVITGREIMPVYYTVNSEESVDVLVTDFYKPDDPKEIAKLHEQFLDSAQFYKKKSIDKSLAAIEKSLEVLSNYDIPEKRAKSFTMLGDVYMFWKQFDLAASNYENALDQEKDIAVQLKLVKAYIANEEYKQAERTLKNILKSENIPNQQLAKIKELQGDVALALQQNKESLAFYKQALSYTNSTQDATISNLNAKMATASARLGQFSMANGFLNNSIQLAEKNDDKKLLLKAKENAADFYNSNRLYDKEIEMRKSNLKDADDMSTSEIAFDSISPQKINYKIATAYISQNKLNEAIPFLEKSIKEADSKEDIVVQKDATRRLSEVYRSVGDYKKALDSYQNYVALVDTLYIRKEQQIAQAARFRRDIASKQERITSLEKEHELQQSKMDLAFKNQQLITQSNQRQQWTIYGLIFGILMLAGLSYLFFRSNKQQRLANNLLALKSLRTQMNPHFIFNALNSVNHYIATNDERNANRFLSQFSILMRSVLENSEEDVIPFSKEIELLQLYIKLEHSRFTDKFDYVFEVSEDVPTDEFKIPPMLLQPYVENAIWHGLRYKEEKGLLQIKVEKLDAERIQISIEDNGIGRKQSAALKTAHQKKQKSKAMGNIKKRISILNSMYKDTVTVEVMDLENPQTGTRVVVILKKD